MSDLREKVQRWLEISRQPLTQAAESMGVSYQILERWMKNSYPCPDNIERQLTEFFAGRDLEDEEMPLISVRIEPPADFMAINMDNPIETLKDYMKAKAISANQISKSLGISPAALSQWLKAKYTGDAAKITEAVISYLEKEREKLLVPKKEIAFTQTSISKRVFEAARICHLENEIGVVYGDAGLGKTAAVRQYAKENPDTILIEADMGHSAPILFREIAEKVGANPYAGRLQDIFIEVVAKLKDSGRLLIIDEAEMLPYKSLEMVRRLNDKANIGILLSGMPRLMANLRGRRGQYAQLYSRVGIAVRLDVLKSKDTEAIVKQLIPNSDKISQIYHSASFGNTRVLTKLLFRSLRVAAINKMELDAEVINETARMLIRK